VTTTQLPPYLRALPEAAMIATKGLDVIRRRLTGLAS
jgi:hypothetical protein